MVEEWGKVTWLDARELEADIDLLRTIDSSTDGEEFLVVNETYGIIKQLKKVILVTTEKCNTGEETITVIPKSWTVSIE